MFQQVRPFHLGDYLEDFNLPMDTWREALVSEQLVLSGYFTQSLSLMKQY